jgi:hypothetical protein
MGDGEMPREQITYPRRRIEDIEPEGGRTPVSVEDSYSHAPEVSVVWNSQGGEMSGWVQIMTNVDRRWVERLLRDDPDTTHVSLYTEILTREECNKLIQVTRRARDRAYGKDA